MLTKVIVKIIFFAAHSITKRKIILSITILIQQHLISLLFVTPNFIASTVISNTPPAAHILQQEAYNTLTSIPVTFTTQPTFRDNNNRS